MKTLPLHDFWQGVDPLYLQFLAEVNRILREIEPTYVAVMPYGSQFKRYPTKESDFDVFLIAGNGKVSMTNHLSLVVKMIGEKFGKSAHSFSAIDESYFLNNFNPRQEKSVYYHALWFLIFPLIGDPEKIQHLRLAGIRRHNEVMAADPEQASKEILQTAGHAIFNEFSVHLAYAEGKIVGLHKNNLGDGETVGKMLTRGWTTEQVVAYIISRGQMWLNRVHQLLDT